MNLFYLLAGIAALTVLATHVFVGGRLFVRPLLAEEHLHRVTRLTLYYCWHLVTLLIAAIAALYLLAAVAPHWQHLAITATVLAASASLLSLLIIIAWRQRPWRMPQWLFFAVVAALGAAGHMA